MRIILIEELTKTVVESGIVTDAGDRYAVAGPVAPLAIPTSLHASLLARLDRLAPTREVAQIGAVLGRSFSHELIGAVAGMPPHKLDDALDQLVRAELIFRRGMPPDAEYTFKHALVQDAAYGTLLKTRRQQIHSKIATTLEGNFLDMVTAQPALLAHHCTEAGLVEKAVGYWLKAGQLSVTRCTMTEAVAQLKKGLELLGGLPNGTQRQEQELGLQITLGQALIANKGYGAPEPGESYDRARQLCQHLDRPQQLGQVLVGQFVFRLARAELDQAERHAEELRQLGEARYDAVWKCFGFERSGTACTFLGKFIEARAHFENYLSLWNPTYRAFWPSPEDLWVASLLNLSRTLLCLGYIDQALLRRNEALAEARRLSPFSLVHALAFVLIGDLADKVRSAEAILRSADELLATSDEHGFPVWLGIGNIIRGWCLGAMGQPAAGISMVLQGLGMHRATGANLLLPFFLTTLAELYGMAAQPVEGLNLIAEAAKLIATSQERWAEAETHRVRGTLFLIMNKHAAAEDSFHHAIAVAQRQSAKFWELRAALDLARLWRDQGKRAEARDLLAPIYGWFTEGFDTPVLQDAEALLDELA
jgi:predicted ATPase